MSGLNLSSNADVVTTWTTLIAMVGGIWWAFGFASQVELNTQGIRVATIRNISQELRYLSTEKQKMILYEQQNGKSVLSSQILTEFDKDIKKLERERDCLKEDKDPHICSEN